MKIFWTFIALICLPGSALAHASDQGFVLLLPTGIYTIGGVVSVGLTVVLVALLPDRKLSVLARGRRVAWPRVAGLRVLTSILSTVLLFGVIFEGLTGSRDPLANLMPLGFWLVFWIGFVTLQGFLGNLWLWVNPWSGVYGLLRRVFTPRCKLSGKLGYIISVVQLFGFAWLLLVDPAPSDPSRLAIIVAIYWGLTLIGMLVFGPVWQRRAELFGAFLGLFAQLSPLKYAATGLWVGWPGWQVIAKPTRFASLAVVPLLMLATGSFDGLNETFWWLGKIGVNPLMYPGRSAVMLPTAIGLILAVVVLLGAFSLALYMGQRLARDSARFIDSFALFAPTVLPIALGYHIAHYLPGFLVEVQYVALTLVQRLGGDPFYVTTSFFFDPDTVRLIWLTQAGAVVLGHVMAVVVAHVLALRHFGTPRRAILSQIPLGIFMVLYTFFGLWLLATPKGG